MKQETEAGAPRRGEQVSACLYWCHCLGCFAACLKECHNGENQGGCHLQGDPSGLYGIHPSHHESHPQFKGTSDGWSSESSYQVATCGEFVCKESVFISKESWVLSRDTTFSFSRARLHGNLVVEVIRPCRHVFSFKNFAINWDTKNPWSVAFSRKSLLTKEDFMWCDWILRFFSKQKFPWSNINVPHISIPPHLGDPKSGSFPGNVPLPRSTWDSRVKLFGVLLWSPLETKDVNVDDER